MRDLRLIGVHEDGQHLLLSDSEGERFRVQLDEPLRAAARRDRPRLGQLQIEIDGGMRPRDVQALIRAGLSAEEVAERAGWPLEKVRRYEGPILAEREYIAGLARGVRLRARAQSGASAPTLAARVSQRLSGRGVDPGQAEWDSARTEAGEWTIVVTFPAGGRERQARWAFDVHARTVAAADDEARWLSEEDSAAIGSPIPAPHLVSAPVRATTVYDVQTYDVSAYDVEVYDVEAEGGVRANSGRSRPAPRGEEPLDLMMAMRERASHRGRPRHRKSPPSQTPLDAAPREDALPLEEIAYDPESMPPPPAARGVHPEDAPPAAPTLPPVVAPAGRAHAGTPAGTTSVSPSRPPGPEVVGDDLLPAADEEPTPAPRPARKSRTSVPSWDDVMFGAKPRD